MTCKCGSLGRVRRSSRDRRFPGWCVRFVSVRRTVGRLRRGLLRCVSDRGCEASGRMLTIGKLGASAGQLEYYERQVAAGAEEYYAGRGEVPGLWIGTGAVALGLEAGGRVSRDGFMALMAGAHPVDGSVLRRMTDRSKVAAIDLTFSAPKSLSVLFAIASGGMSDALAEAHERAVAAAVGYL